MKILRIFTFLALFLSLSIAASPIKVVNQVENTEDRLKVLDNTPVVYCSVKDLARVLSTTIYENTEREKIVLYLGVHRVKVSSGTSFLVIDDVIYQFPAPAIIVEGDIYLPTIALFQILHKTVLPSVSFIAKDNQLVIIPTEYNIQSVQVDEKANGTIIRIKTLKKFKKKEISTFLHKNGWFYLTIQGGAADSTNILKADTRGIVKKILMDQLEGGLQLAFFLRSEIERHEFYQNKKTKEIVITLWAPLSKSVARIREVKRQWEIDTIVLDAGHGGKDPGTIGKYGTKEKTIALDIVKRIGRMLIKNTNVKVVYTREEDIFIPLWKRTKIANEKNGKIFISVHANGNRNRDAHGFETYLLRPGKTQDAIDVAAQENAAIKYEESRNGKYKELTYEGQILATMAQSMFMKESESLAAQIQQELEKEIKSQSRGVKQAGFYVLVGASMPNVLLEVGFLTNPNEEKKLQTVKYRQKIADAVYRAIVEFKKSREFVMAEG
ncbi:MAG: N-acetylmuramoyl-L-alanine amidase [Candidatus Marinimicrobia bacterium]|nr:N-acetylmuramoyl-L-alanine amidase [Candidatus Neomarinimicrobiota bacterium]